MGKLEIPAPYPKQIQFFEAQSKYIAYGGARGGGKSWAARVKAIALALNNSGMQILLLRRDLQSLRENHLLPLQKLLKGVATYRASTRDFTFPNGSRIILGYCAAESDVLQYQGQAYDVIFMEEATHFTEFQFQTLTESNRSSGQMDKPFESRMYFTCNPGGVGHAWVKRLFIDKQYKETERASDYTFIKSLVYENEHLMKNDPSYIRNLENLPPDRRRAMLDGDWDVYEGQYFSEFNRNIHVMEPFAIPRHWNRYISIDYGLDMFAALWIAVDEHGRGYVYKEIHESNLIISDAARRLKEVNNGENILMSFAPPDLFNRRQDTGKSAVDIFLENGWYFYKSNNNRVQGWYDLKEWMKPVEQKDGTHRARLVIFSNCVNLIRCLPLLQHDEKKPEDVATEPHEYTHAPDALRGFVCGRPTASEPAPMPVPDELIDEEEIDDIDSFLSFGG